MPRKKHASRHIRTNPGQQVEPFAVGVRISPAGDTVRCQVGFDMADDRSVRLQADTWKGNKIGKQRNGRLTSRMRDGCHAGTR